MTLLHQAAQKAVEALKEIAEARYEHDYFNVHRLANAAKTELESALQQQPDLEWVAQVVSSGPHNFPLLEWRSANHSLETAIGAKLYTAPPALQHQEVPAAVRAALVELLAAHTEAAGFTMSMACDRQQFDEFLARTQKRVDDAVAQAQAALASSPSTTRQQEDGNV